jgi:hypothetical protein
MSWAYSDTVRPKYRTLVPPIQLMLIVAVYPGQWPLTTDAKQ